jgi:hypothetical protein
MGDIDFVYANAKSLGGLFVFPEFGAPSIAEVAGAIVNLPIHVIYVAGMEFKRLRGIVSEETAEDLCDLAVAAMDVFKDTSPGNCAGAGELLLSDVERTWSGASPMVEIAEFSILDAIPWEGTYETPAEFPAFTVVDEITWEGTYETPAEFPGFTMSDAIPWEGTYETPEEFPEFTLTDTLAWNGTTEIPGSGEFTFSDAITWGGSDADASAGKFIGIREFVINYPGGGSSAGTVNF